MTAFCPAALRAEWREVQNPWSEEYTAPSLLSLCWRIFGVTGVFGRGLRSWSSMEPDLHAQQVSRSNAPKKENVPVNHKDAVTLWETSKSRHKALRNVHMESLPQDYWVSACEHVSVVGNVAQPCSLIRRRRGMEHGQGTIGRLCRWVRRSRLMFRTWKTRVTIRDPWVGAWEGLPPHIWSLMGHLLVFGNRGWRAVTHHLANLAWSSLGYGSTNWLVTGTSARHWHAFEAYR